MFCSRCGQESQPDQRFCKGCGAALGALGNGESLSPVAVAPLVQAVPLSAQPQAQYPPSPAPIPYPQAQTPSQFPPPPVTTPYPQAPPPYPPPGMTPVMYQAYPGQPQGSKSNALFIGIACLAVVAGVICVTVYKNQNHGMVMIGTKDQVVYSGTATKDQATALGNALKADGYFQDQGASVLLDKETSGTTISYVVKDGFWNQEGVVAKFDELTREVASSVGGLPLNVQLMNDTKTVEKTSSVGSVAFGNDTVVYEGAATQAEAQALGQKLQSLGFLSGKGVDVLLGKHTSGTTIAFVVGDGVWNDANTVSGFEDLVRQAAPAVGGLPIKMLLLSTTLQKEKDEQIQ